jgi:hypothetical protein
MPANSHMRSTLIGAALLGCGLVGVLIAPVRGAYLRGVCRASMRKALFRYRVMWLV